MYAAHLAVGQVGEAGVPGHVEAGGGVVHAVHRPRPLQLLVGWGGYWDDFLLLINIALANRNSLTLKILLVLA